MKIVETEDMMRSANASDLIYMTRIQKERFSDLSEYERVKGSFVIDRGVPEKIEEENYHPPSASEGG